MPEALSVDAAVAQLDAAAEAPPEEQAPAVAQAEPAAEAEAQPVEGEEIEAADPAAEVEGDPEEVIAEEPAEEPAPDARPASEAPRSWDASERDEFARLPRAIQDIVLTREAERDSRVSRAVQEANDAKTAATADAAKVDKLASELTQFLPQALKTFEDRWGQAPDWIAVANERGADEAFKLKAQYDFERQQIGELARKESEANALAHQNFVRLEMEKLTTLSPELSHPETGPKLRADVASYAMSQGAVTQADLPNVSAAQLAVAHKAMLWDQAQAALKNPKPKEPAPTAAAQRPAARPAVRPSAAPAAASTQARSAQQAASQFAKSRSVDDAVALLETRKRA